MTLRWDKINKCKTSNAAAWFIGMGFSQFHDFSMTFDDFSKFFDFPWLFQKILLFPGFPDPVGTLTSRFDRWPWKRIGHLFYATSSFVPPFAAIYEFKLDLQSGNAQFGSKSMIFCAVWPWNLKYDISVQNSTKKVVSPAALNLKS